MHWPSRLARFRKKYGLSRNDLAKHLSCSVRTIERWESDPPSRTPPAFLMLALLYLATKLQRESEDTHAPAKRE